MSDLFQGRSGRKSTKTKVGALRFAAEGQADDGQLLGVAVWYLPLIKKNERIRKEILRLDARIEKERETGRQLQNAIDALKRDPKAIERLARERLGYAKPGETVIRFESPATNVVTRQF